MIPNQSVLKSSPLILQKFNNIRKLCTYLSYENNNVKEQKAHMTLSTYATANFSIVDGDVSFSTLEIDGGNLKSKKVEWWFWIPTIKFFQSCCHQFPTFHDGKFPHYKTLFIVVITVFLKYLSLDIWAKCLLINCVCQGTVDWFIVHMYFRGIQSSRDVR